MTREDVIKVLEKYDTVKVESKGNDNYFISILNEEFICLINEKANGLCCGRKNHELRVTHQMNIYGMGILYLMENEIKEFLERNAA